MTLAFQSVFFLLVAFPGLAFRRVYSRSVTGRPPRGILPVTEEIAKSFVLAIALHLVALALVGLLGWTPDIDAIVRLAIGGTPDAAVIQSVGRSAFEVVGYFTFVLTTSAFLGSRSGWLVRRFQLDKKFSFLRVGDEWHYVLLGEYKQLRGVDEHPRAADVFVTAAVEIDAAAYLYLGFLEEFYYDQTGALDRIVLVSASRRTLIREGKPADGADDPDRGFYRIEGDYVVIPYREIKNLDIQYVYADEE